MNTVSNTENNIPEGRKPHRFFERFLDNDLEELSFFLQSQYKRIENGDLVSGTLNSDGDFAESNSLSTMNWYQYNAFQFYHPSIHKLLRSIKSMVVEACDYYDVNILEQDYYVQGWFNINYADNGKLKWHDHGPTPAPNYHGYYCVNAQPSITHYEVFGKQIENHNINNRAILSEVGHPHAMGDWNWDGPRITLAYDVTPYRDIHKDWEQHWIPLV